SSNSIQENWFLNDDWPCVDGVTPPSTRGGVRTTVVTCAPNHPVAVHWVVWNPMNVDVELSDIVVFAERRSDKKIICSDYGFANNRPNGGVVEMRGKELLILSAD